MSARPLAPTREREMKKKNTNRAKQLIAGLGLMLTAGLAPAQQACNPPAPQVDSGASFVAFGPREQLLARGGNSGPAWEWALGTDTDADGQNVKASHDWISGKSYQWTLTYSGTAATVELKDGATLLFTRSFASGMDRGNALELQLSTNAGIGPDTTVAATVATLNGQPVAASLAQSGNNQEAAQSRYLFYPPLANGITAEGTVSLTYTSLPTGSRVGFSVRAGTVNCVTFPPTVSLTAPTNNAVFTAPATIEVSANAADSDGTVTKVEFYEGANLIGTDTTAPYAISWANVAAGSYSLSAKATDNQGVSATSAPVTILVNAAPTVSLTSPANGALFTAPATIALAASATDADGSIAQVEFFQGAALLATVTSAPYTHTLTNVAAGTYSFTARATDNQGATTTSTAVTVTVNAAPTITLASPANDATFTAPADITITADAQDTDGTISQVEFFEGANLIATRTTAPYSIVWTGVPAGSYSLTARATDNRGASTTSGAVSVTVNSGAATMYFIHADHLNSPRRIYNQAGQEVWRWDNTEPFGDSVPNENPSGLGTFTCNLRFAGQYFDKETNLHYNYFRDYDSATGRYVQSDPVGLQGGINTYLYVLDPLTQIDPAGLMGYGGGGSASKATPRWPGRVTSPVPTSTPSAASSSPSCNGRWVAVGGTDPQLPRILRLCTCYWLCMDCKYPVMWSGNKYDLPSTTNQITFDPSTARSSNDGDVESGNYCLCIRKPGPETGCACK